MKTFLGIICILFSATGFCQNFSQDSISILNEKGMLKRISVNGYVMNFESQKLVSLFYRDSVISYNPISNSVMMRNAEQKLMSLTLTDQAEIKVCSSSENSCIKRRGTFKERMIGNFSFEHLFVDSSIVSFTYKGDFLYGVSLANRWFGGVSLTFDSLGSRKKEILFKEYLEKYKETDFLFSISLSFDKNGLLTQLSVYDVRLQEGLEVLFGKEGVYLIRERTLARKNPVLYKYRDIHRYR